MVKFSKCCTPVPGDEIIGFVTKGYGVSVHRKDCINVRNSMNKEEEYGRWLRIEWDTPDNTRKYNVAIRIIAKSRTGVLAEVANTFSNMKIGITELNVKDNPGGDAIFFVTALVNGTEQLNLLIQRLKRSSNIIDVYRHMEGKEGL